MNQLFLKFNVLCSQQFYIRGAPAMIQVLYILMNILQLHQVSVTMGTRYQAGSMELIYSIQIYFMVMVIYIHTVLLYWTYNSLSKFILYVQLC